ncbi:hypothetical protein GGI00_001686, partial [Coemansia sp. RSA 2681]
SAFTREYKKTSHPVAFQTIASAAASKAATASVSIKPDMEDVIDDDDDGAVAIDDSDEMEDDDEQSGDSLDKDALIKATTKPKAGTSGRAASSGGTSGRGRGRGRGAKAGSASAQPRKTRNADD